LVQLLPWVLLVDVVAAAVVAVALEVMPLPRTSLG
jgi:hypothetical protein